MRTKILLPVLMYIVSICNTHAQNIFPSTGAAGIGTTTPDASSLLEIKSTTKGLLIPRMTQAQRNVITSPATGLMIYQTNATPGFYYYGGGGWKSVAPKAWNLTGNAGTDSSINFIGTTDALPLVFRVNNVRAGFIGYGTSNTSFGYQAFRSNTTGNYNTATGTYSLSANTTGNNNTANGSYTLLNNTTGIYNAATGADALHNNTTGNYNAANGAASLYSNTTGYYNTANGYQSLYTNATGFANTASGYQSLYFNTSGYQNTAAGLDALRSNTSGYNNTATGLGALLLNNLGNSNTANGYSALAANTSGNNNTAVGNFALLSNTTGHSNVALGVSALSSNTTANNLVAIGDSALYNNGIYGIENTAIGSKALFNNIYEQSNTAVGYKALYSTNGNETFDGSNTAVGDEALYSNTSGNTNTATGNQALYSDTIGYANTADGEEALYHNTTGAYNTAQGRFAGSNNETGNNNTYIGYSTGANANNYTGSTAIGESSVITATEQMRFGNVSITSIGGYANWTNISDGRVKKNIKQNVPGLIFINKLQPITYNLDLDAADKIIQKPQIKDKDGEPVQSPTDDVAARKAKEQIVYTGFIAQDVEKAAKSLNYDFSGVDAAKNDKDLYGLRYSDFVVPLVKGEQELSKENDSLKSIVSSLRNQIDELKAMIVSNKSAGNSELLTVAASASLQQNIPNPFTNTTVIGYTLPQKFTSAQILISDKNGIALKAITISGSGKGTVNVDASTLSSGAYQYSLIVDGRLIDTKQMVLAK